MVNVCKIPYKINKYMMICQFKYKFYFVTVFVFFFYFIFTHKRNYFEQKISDFGTTKW